MKSVCVFCGSATGANPQHADTARTLGSELARRNLTLVYGGGKVGLLGEVAAACVRAGGTVIGVIPQALAEKEIAYPECSELIVVGTMHDRKSRMADR
ncbi:MAG: LOG family protein, partial [Fimbriiglobus sp.]